MGLCSYQRLFSILILFCFAAIDTITSTQILKDPQTLTSDGGNYTLGFFSPENSTNRYVGIWYKSKFAVIWVANRDQPLRDSSGILAISEDRNLVVLNGEKQVIWSSNVSNIASNSTAQLQDSGNLVLLDNTTRNTLWESFKHPSDTLFPNMKFSSNRKTGERVKLTSWKSPSDPSKGNFSITLESLNIPELYIWDGTQPYWRSGPWNGQVFIGIQRMYSMYLDGFTLGNEGDGTVYLIFHFSNKSELATFVLNSQGQLEERDWNSEKEEWEVNFTVQKSDCDVYGTCGAFGVCNAQSYPICSCLRGFEPRNREEWKRQKWTSGCIRRTDLQCERVKNGSADSKEDGFLKLQMIKVPDLVERQTESDSEENCRSQCLKNCSCIAYSYDAGIGCMSWRRNLIDIQQFSSGGTDLYIRLAYSELGKEERDKSVIITITVTVIIGTIIIVTCAYFFWKWTGRHSRTDKINDSSLIGELSEQELLLYDFEEVATATNNFHSSNKLGQGGFGSVYKGKLRDGREIAAKRLSKASRQGVEEFKNEALVISKVQHRNLVKLLGCCLERDEKILIYEYMPNKSLDAIVFDPLKRKFLDWRTRFNIIERIARGLIYLHRDSRLRIIHRDLKASNILLDNDLNPKISDFGMARIFGGNEDRANTQRIVGTYGYMAPEYAMEGSFSEKSDVFSFGILLLEIVSGRRNSSFHNNDESLSLLGLAWKLWNEDKMVTLIDPELSEPALEKDILRCLQIGLVCAQEHARERPSMATVISMLNSEIVNLPSPSQPGFTQRQNMMSSESSADKSLGLHSNNSVSITDIQGR